MYCTCHAVIVSLIYVRDQSQASLPLIFYIFKPLIHYFFFVLHINFHALTVSLIYIRDQSQASLPLFYFFFFLYCTCVTISLIYIRDQSQAFIYVCIIIIIILFQIIDEIEDATRLPDFPTHQKDTIKTNLFYKPWISGCKFR